MLLRRNVTVSTSPAEGGGARIEIGGEWPVGVISSRLSLRVSGLRVSGTPRLEYLTLPRGGSLRRTVYSVIYDGADWIITLDAVPGAVIEVGE